MSNPPDRAEDILSEAARLFRRSGYHAVGVDEIGEAVGITGGAIYRHFESKEELLTKMVDRVVARLAELLATTLHQDREPTLRLLAELTVRIALEDSDVMSAYQHEMRSLPAELRERVRDQQRKVARVWARALRAEVPGISATEARFRTAALIAVALAPLSYDSAMPTADFQALLVRMVLAAGRVPVNRVRSRAPRTGEPADPQTARRRERILREAITLFRRHGYPAVTMEAIGRAAGIDGSSVYRHYRDKESIFLAAYEIAGQQLLATIDSVESAADGAEPAVVDFFASYFDHAMHNRDLTAIWITESVHVRGPRSRAARQMQRAYLDRLVHAMHAARPDIDDANAQALVRAIFLLINGVVSLGPSTGFSEARMRALLLSMCQACIGVRPPRAASTRADAKRTRK